MIFRLFWSNCIGNRQFTSVFHFKVAYGSSQTCMRNKFIRPRLKWAYLHLTVLCCFEECSFTWKQQIKRLKILLNFSKVSFASKKAVDAHWFSSLFIFPKRVSIGGNLIKAVVLIWISRWTISRSSFLSFF